ncbi:MAG TPA: Asp-tRNA(Asn)/Glu-tRNA(Gln) amidotransferase subunit GatC [Terriglobia bacterium]|nr:Asp-tRNA(Asn)/Glu-tRNA(Gln) amidotransferase subunit GatC [Terriglobia bacterium]
MPLNEKDVRYVADLAHLELTDEEVRKFQPQLDAILGHMQTLNQLDTTNVEPMAQVIALESPNASLRADEVRKSFPQSVAVAGAPGAAEGYFKVPRVIERE